MKLPNLNKQTHLRYTQILSLIENSKDKVVLDIGSGLNALSNFVPAKEIQTIDFDPKHSPTYICNLNEGVLPVKDESIDLIIAGEIMEHLTDPNEIVKEFFRVLKKGGVVVMSTPNICSLINRLKMIFGQIPSYSCFPTKGTNPHRHFTDYSLKILKEMFEEEGFKLNKLKTNGIITRGKLIFPISLTPATFGENLIVRFKK